MGKFQKRKGGKNNVKSEAAVLVFRPSHAELLVQRLPTKIPRGRGRIKKQKSFVVRVTIRAV